jgi:hypothetical protein
MPMPGLDRPPMPPPGIQGQMGVPQQAPPGLGGLAAQRPAGGPPGAPAPGAPDQHGALVSQVEAVKKVLEQMGSNEPVMAPFAARATAILESGMAAVRSAPSATPPGTETGPPGAQGTPPTPGGPGQMPALG